ncbi:hypothetical protein MMC07_004161 [Pseudocyphellaria aurata]|nr:hypothetical protein [Pseudocyphellaria aurata]
MLPSSLVGPQSNFHGDDALHDKTPRVQGLVASLPATVPALWEEGKRAAIAKLPLNNFFSQWFMKTGVERLWGAMLHPPLSYLGDSFQYRSADGGNNVRQCRSFNFLSRWDTDPNLIRVYSIPT